MSFHHRATEDTEDTEGTGEEKKKENVSLGSGVYQVNP
jgi:hypothetical protein